MPTPPKYTSYVFRWSPPSRIEGIHVWLSEMTTSIFSPLSGVDGCFHSDFNNFYANVDVYVIFFKVNECFLFFFQLPILHVLPDCSNVPQHNCICGCVETAWRPNDGWRLTTSRGSRRSSWRIASRFTVLPMGAALSRATTSSWLFPCRSTPLTCTQSEYKASI